MATGEVRVLGPVEIVSDDRAIQPSGKQARLLAALLVVHGRACSVDELVDAIWDGAAPASARKLVQVYVSQLRKVLPPGIELATRQGTYALSVEADALDARRFERLLRESDDALADANAALALSLVDRALALWRGAPYGELTYDDFVRAESERLAELRVAAVETRLAAQLELGRAPDVLGEVLAHAEANPLGERAHELAMLALYRCGRQAEALEHYTTFHARLDEELGLAPGPSLRELQRRILQQDPLLAVAADARPDAALPLPPNPLVGRERELEALRALLDRRDSRLVVLTGAGGSGKTRLALEAARAAAGAYANGAAFVELAPLRDPALVPTAIARTLRIAEIPGEPLADTLERVLAPQELLLVVDNAEHLRVSAPLFSRLVAGAPRLTILVTSRAVLHVSGEQVFPVAPLEEDDARDLFVERALQLAPEFDPTSEDEAHVREICGRLDCLPLAIELAAARIRTLPPAALRERLDARLALLTGGPRDLPARQQTLGETIAWSFDLLDKEQQRALARLAVFPGGATLAAAEAVCECDLDTLSVLVDDHLVVHEDGPDEPRFVLLETIREFALDAHRAPPAPPPGPPPAAVERELSSYFADLVDSAKLRGSGMEDWMRRLDGDVDNLRAALDAAAGSDVELRLAGGLWRYWLIRGFLAEGRERIEGALGRSDESATYASARALGGGATLAFSHGDVARATELAERCIGDAREARAPLLESIGHRVLAGVAASQGDFEMARRHHERCIEIVERAGEEPALEKLNLGVVALRSGDVARALELFEDVLEFWRRHDVSEGIGFAVLNRGFALLDLGDVDPARRDFEEALQCFEELGYRAQIAGALQGLAATEVAAGRHVEAARLLGRAAALLAEAAWLSDSHRIERARKVEEAARRALGDDAFEAAFAATD